MFDAAVKTTVQDELPFPFNKRAFCHYEPIEKRIEHARVLIVNCLLRYESDLSPLAAEDWGDTIETKLRFERKVSSLACNNIAQNVIRLVKNPKTLTVHLSEVAEAARDFNPDAIVISGTFSDFDYYNQAHLESFRTFITGTEIPVLAICGSHQLVGMSFGADLKTLDNLKPSEKRKDRDIEYQYKFIKITDCRSKAFPKDSNFWQLRICAKTKSWSNALINN